MRSRMTRFVTPLAALTAFAAGALWPSVARSEDLPQIRWDKPVVCMRNTAGEEVRVQCAEPPPVAEGEGKKPGARRFTCLVAPNAMRAYGGELDRVQECSRNDEPDAYRKLVASGAQMVSAIAEAPPGYARSEAGRVYQVKFDLLNRVYLGVNWQPTFNRGGLGLESFNLGRAQAEMGISLSVLSPRGRSRHDMKILDGSAALDDMELKGMLFSYDYQHMHRRPAFWITSFIGPPQVFDVTPRLGWGFRLVTINDRPPAFRNTFDLEVAEAHLSWNPWQSNDMFSHLRFEVGGDFGKFWEDRGLLAKGLETGAWYAGITSAVKSRFSLGEGGLHYIFLDVAYHRPTFVESTYSGESIHRVRASMAYEAIVLAVNDQPVSLRVAAIGSSRQDPATGAQSFEATALAGLRVSFWAPPRIFEPLPEFEDP